MKLLIAYIYTEASILYKSAYWSVMTISRVLTACIPSSSKSESKSKLAKSPEDCFNAKCCIEKYLKINDSGEENNIVNQKKHIQ